MAEGGARSDGTIGAQSGNADGPTPLARRRSAWAAPSDRLMDDHHLTELMRNHGPAVWRLSATLLRDVADAAEAVDRTFATARPLLESTHDSATARLVLLRVCRTVCLDHRRHVAGAALRRPA